jgi:ubiquinone/menaquinone biosynthesis C-methylase UbiE
MASSYALMYKRLADFFVENMNFKGVSNIIEVGCGKGQLTIPFVEKITRFKKHFKLVAFDMSAGPYEGDLNVLEKKISTQRLGRLITVVRGDVTDMRTMSNESFDIVVSNELLCGLNRGGLERAFKEFHRILRPEGQMVHGELSPVPESEAQRLLIEADGFGESVQPHPKWFSPYSDEVAALLHKTGFRNIRTEYFETKVKMTCKEAIRQLKQWNIDSAFIQSHLTELETNGLELPLEHVIFCEK